MTRGHETLTAIFAVARDPGLSAEELRLWLLYRSYDSKGTGAWASDELMARHMGKSVRSVQAYRASLLARGYLTQRLRGPTTALYRAVVAPLDPGAEARGGEVDQMADDCLELLCLAWPSVTQPDKRPAVLAKIAAQEPDLWQRAGRAFQRLDLAKIVDKDNQAHLPAIVEQLARLPRVA